MMLTRSIMAFDRDRDRSGGPEGSAIRSRSQGGYGAHQAREAKDARVGEVQQELQELGKKFESLERDFKMKESELGKALLSMKDAKAEAKKSQQEIQVAK